MIVDAHAHLVDRAYAEELTQHLGLSVQRDPGGQTFLRGAHHSVLWFRDEFLSLDARLRRMDELGVTMRLLSLSTPNVYPWDGVAQVDVCRRSNDALLAAAQAHPDRFRAIASLPLSDTEAALAELDRVAAAPGFAGVLIGSNVSGLQLDAQRFEPLWARLDAGRIPVIEHPMMPPEGDPAMQGYEMPLRVGLIYDTTTMLTRMIYGGVFSRYPNFPMVVAHTGGALLSLLQRLDNGWRLFPDCRAHLDEPPSTVAKRLFFDTCAFSAPALRMALEIVGPEHLLWGADDPFIGADTVHVRALNLPAEQEALILGGNARRLFGLG
ncbi:amidohydrolase family protein [Roseomonas sp. BN140053]|uniref:amidohydrolase family protein n=1 Tax=Roseomonas sp. BN140053 TaxID=3391898 RepID=UPI0039ED0F53